jgi:hypothetical protein
VAARWERRDERQDREPARPRNPYHSTLDHMLVQKQSVGSKSQAFIGAAPEAESGTTSAAHQSTATEQLGGE